MRKRILATVAALAMIVAMLPTIVMAGSNSNTVTLDVSKGVIDLYPEGYAQTDVEFQCDEYIGDVWVATDRLTPGDANGDYYDDDRGKSYPRAWKEFKGTYIITGQSGYTDSTDENDISEEIYNSGKDTILDIMNFSGKPVEYNLVFEDLKIRAYDWSTAIRFKGNAPITVNIINKGNTVIEGHNHPAFKINDNDMNSNDVYVNIYNTLGSSLSFADRLGTESEEWDDALGEDVTIKRAQIYGSDQKVKGIIIFKINNEVVDNGSNGGTITNEGESFEDVHDSHNYENTSQSSVNAFWSHESLKMTASQFKNNEKNVVCTFKCAGCNDAKDVTPTVVGIDEENKTGTYKAVLVDETTGKELASSTMAYELIADGATGTASDGTTTSENTGNIGNTGNAGSSEADGNSEDDSDAAKDDNKDKTPDSGDHTNLILWACLMAVSGVGAAVVIGRRRFER